jgi:sporulation protein YlmC with PRC-barrel domain
MTDAQDLGEPVSYLVTKNGTPVFDSSGDRAGEVEHVLADDEDDVFHGLIVKTSDGHRFAGADQIDGIYEHAVIVSSPVAQLPEPSKDAVPESGLRRAWDWLVGPK